RGIWARPARRLRRHSPRGLPDLSKCRLGFLQLGFSTHPLAQLLIQEALFHREFPVSKRGSYHSMICSNTPAVALASPLVVMIGRRSEFAHECSIVANSTGYIPARQGIGPPLRGR